MSAWAQTDQPCKFQVIAGPPSTSGGDGGPATSAYLLQPNGVSVDAQGNLFIADTQNHRIREVRADGTIVTIAGTGVAGNVGDGGSAIGAQLSAPEGVLAAPDGNLYISDTGNHRIRRITPDGNILPFAGGHSGFSGDGGPAIAAELSMPTGLAIGPDGSVYFADTGNNRIRRVDPSGLITTVAGSQNGVPTGHGPPDPCCFGGDGGLATMARLNAPRGVAVGSDGTIYLADTNNAVIRKVDGSGTITTLAGAPTNPIANYPQPAAKAFIGNATSVAIGENGSIIIGSTDILQLTPDGVLNLFESPFVLDGFGASNFNVTTDGSGVVYASDAPLNVVWNVPAPGQKRILAGQFYFGLGTEGGSAIGPTLHTPQGMAVGTDGSVYVADTLNHRVRKISADGTIQTIAGGGTAGSSDDGGPATSIRLSTPGGLALDGSGNVYVADAGSSAILKLLGDGTIRTIASPNPGNGRIQLEFSSPRGLAVQSNGDIVVWLDARTGSSPPKIVMLTGGAAIELSGFDREFQITHPQYAGISLDSSGNLLFAEGPSLQRRRIDGTGVSSVNTGGQGAFSYTPAGDLFISAYLGRIKQQVGTVFPTSYNRDLSEFLGTPEPALSPVYSTPSNATSFATDSQGNLYIAD
ncbi:MAG TPA: hypothetical protein VEU96_08965, partial [Bryobacteraceae bacterium]|nr:hypothetical protein [Bryobacteraceae bacterium]